MYFLDITGYTKNMEQPPNVTEAVLDIAEKLFEKEEYLSRSEHLMYVGRKKDELEYT